MDRYAALERLQARAHRQLPAAAREQFAPFRTLASEWARLAVSGTDADLLSLLLDQGTTRAPARLLRSADPAPIARALEQAMAPALLTGATTRQPRQVRAAAGKPCGNSFIPAWKECRLKISEPDWTGDAGAMKTRALESMAKIRKPLSHPGTGIEMSMNREARKKTVLQAKSTHAYMAAGHLTEIFLHSSYKGHTPDKKARRQIKAFHEFETSVAFGTTVYTATITTTEYVGQETHHFKVLHLRPKNRSPGHMLASQGDRHLNSNSHPTTPGPRCQVACRPAPPAPPAPPPPRHSSLITRHFPK